MSDPASRNIYRLQGALHRITQALKTGRDEIFAHFLHFMEDRGVVNNLPMVAKMNKALNKPLGDVTRRELIEMWLGKEDLARLDATLHYLAEGDAFSFYKDYDEASNRIGALRRLLEG